MKKSFIVLILIPSLNLFAQGNWWPISVHVEIPAITQHVNLSTSVTTNDTSLVGFSPPEYVLQDLRYRHVSTQKGDSVRISWHIFDTIHDDQFIHFTIDTINKKILRFGFEFIWDHSTFEPQMYQEHELKNDDEFHFSSLHYEGNNDTIRVKESAEAGKSELINALHSYIDANYYTPPRSPHTESGDSYQSIKLLDDTSKFRCQMLFVRERPVDNVPLMKGSHPFFIYTSLSDHTTRFSFPASDHAQNMTIYDILGREVSKIEIPAGNATYELSTVGYPRGTFFARRGSTVAHFEVN